MKGPSRVPPRNPEGSVNAIVEIPRGGRVKYKVDERSGTLAFGKVLPAGFVFPFNFGSIPSTLAPDGDPLDVVVLLDEALALGTVVAVELAAVIEAKQTSEGKTTRNDRLVGVVTAGKGGGKRPPAPAPSPVVFEEIERFFVAYNEQQHKTFVPLSRKGPERARELLAQALARWKRRHAPRRAPARSRRSSPGSDSSRRRPAARPAR